MDDSIGNLLVQKRAVLGLVQEDFAILTGLSGKYISAIENGRPVPKRTENLIKSLLDLPDNQIRQQLLEKREARNRQQALEENLTILLTDADRLIRDHLKNRPNGSKTFILTASTIAEADDYDILSDVYEGIREKPDSTIYYIVPSPNSWSDVANAPHINAGRANVQNSKTRLERGFGKLGLSKKQISEQIKHIEISNSHYHHPIVKTILLVNPLDKPIDPWGKTQIGILEIPSEQNPVIFRLSNSYTDELFRFLETIEAIDVFPHLEKKR